LGAQANATTVAVLEVGKGGVAHRTTSTAPTTSTAGIASFWNSIHDEVNGSAKKSGHRRTRFTQYPGMTVVPDLFSRPDGGLAIGLFGTGVDLKSMPTVAGILENPGAVGHFYVDGNNGKALMSKTAGSDNADISNIHLIMEEKMHLAASKESGNRLESLAVNIDDVETATQVDSSIARMLETLEKVTAESGSTIVIHLVIDNHDSSVNRRADTSRMLAGGK